MFEYELRLSDFNRTDVTVSRDSAWPSNPWVVEAPAANGKKAVALRIIERGSVTHNGTDDSLTFLFRDEASARKAAQALSYAIGQCSEKLEPVVVFGGYRDWKEVRPDNKIFTALFPKTPRYYKTYREGFVAHRYTLNADPSDGVVYEAVCMEYAHELRRSAKEVLHTVAASGGWLITSEFPVKLDYHSGVEAIIKTPDNKFTRSLYFVEFNKIYLLSFTAAVKSTLQSLRIEYFIKNFKMPPAPATMQVDPLITKQ